jgi:beta-lysine 5,6-aminomutase alpha subunit
MSKLDLDRDKIELARKIAEEVVSPVYHYIERHTTVSIERCVLRLLGVRGTAEEKPKGGAPQGRYPLVNEVIHKIGLDRLDRGAGYWFGLAAVHHPRVDPVTLARKIVSGEVEFGKLPRASQEEIHQACQRMLSRQIERLRQVRELRSKRPPRRTYGHPLKYLIVATGDIHEDIVQAKAAAEMGADIIAVIRSTAQSLLDYVPEGETTEGYGGTFATQKNFSLMREALDEAERRLKRRIGLTNYSSGLCMPEIAVIGALEGVDYLLNDAMYGILFRDINMKRNFVDQHFSRRICALSGITIQTGEDNYLTTADSYKYWYQVLSSHFINQAFAKKAGLTDPHIALGHAFEIDPWIEDSMLYEWAQAQLVREIFPRSPIKFMPPTKHKSGDIFFSYLYDGMFNLAGILTGQTIQLLGMHTEAIHNPFIQDRFLSIKNANYVFNAAKSAQDEVLFQPHGRVARRARQVLDDAVQLLKKVSVRGLFRAIEEGAFANVRRREEGGKGFDGVVHKDRDYYTPLQEYLTPRTPAREEEKRGPRFGPRGTRRGTKPVAAPRRGTRGRGRGDRRDRRSRPQERDRRPYPQRDFNKNAPAPGRGSAERAPRVQEQQPKPAAPAANSEVILLPPPQGETARVEATPPTLPRRPLKVEKDTPKEPSGPAPHHPGAVPQDVPEKPAAPLPRRPLKLDKNDSGNGAGGSNDSET